jgi:hypothetical protein
MLIVLEPQAEKSGITGHKNFIGLIFLFKFFMFQPSEKWQQSLTSYFLFYMLRKLLYYVELAVS